MKGNEADLRAAVHRAFGFASGYPDPAVINRIAAAAHADRSRRQVRLPGWAGGALAGIATLAVGAIVILTLLAIPRGAAPAAHPAANPSVHTRLVKQMALGFGIGGGAVTFDGHDLPPNAKVDITVHQGSASEEFFTTADSQGNAHASVPEPTSFAPGWVDLSICIQPVDSSMTCLAQRVSVPGATPTLPAPTPSCPPGTRETSRSTPAPNGSYWLGCLGTA